MTTDGPNLAGTTADSNAFGFGTVAWVNPTNAQAEDGTFTTQTLAGAGGHELKCTNFGFAVPAGAVVSAILYAVDVKIDSGTDTTYYMLGCTGGTYDGADNGGPGFQITTTLTWKNFWNRTTALPTVANINGSGFGFFFVSQTGPSGVAVSVDAARISVTYTLPSGKSYRQVRQAVNRSSFY